MRVPSPGREHSMKRMRPAEASLRIQLASRERFMMSCGSLSPNVDTARGLEEDASRGCSKLVAGPRSRCLMRTTVKKEALHETKEETGTGAAQESGTLEDEPRIGILLSVGVVDRDRN